MPRLAVCTLLIGILAIDSGWANDLQKYEREIKPLLKARCYACHGALKQESGLRLDTVNKMIAGGDSGPAIQPGKAAGSEILKRLTSPNGDLRMPPEGEPLTKAQIATIRTWINNGAPRPTDEQPEEDPKEHWAFKRPVRPSLSAKAASDKAASDSANAIDLLIQRKREQEGLQPLGQARPEILLRRVYLDLTGLPPSRAELRKFLANKSPDAYQQVVQRLLDSKQYGERWGRHWMDIWRYSDWYGRRQVNDVRNSYPHIWRWRDWIIDSLNEDKGYDQMVREMLAADELTPADDTRTPALGFIVRNWFSLNYDTWKQDLVEHTGKAFLALRLNCAHCHDHKYDPIKQEEYFRFRAFFEPIEFRHDRVPGGPALSKYIRYKPGSGGSLKPIAAGLPRIYDFDLKAQTFMYRLGDTRDRFDRPPVTPAAPAILGGDRLTIRPVKLPPTAWYPGLKPFAQDEEIKSLETKRNAADAAVVTATTTANKSQLHYETLALRRAKLKAAAIPKASAQPRRSKDLIARWRFESSNLLGDSGPMPVTLTAPNTAAKQAPALGSLLRPFGKIDPNQSAIVFDGTSVATLRAPLKPAQLSDEFSVELLAHPTRNQTNLNQTLIAIPNRWSLMLRGVDDKRMELRVRLASAAGPIFDASTSRLDHPETGPGTISVSAPAFLQTNRTYYVAMVVTKTTITLWVGDLTTKSALQQFAIDRPSQGQPVELARPEQPSITIGNEDGTSQFAGRLDEIVLSRVALSAKQIAATLGRSATPLIQQLDAAIYKSRSQLVRDKAQLAMQQALLDQATAELQAFQARAAADNTRFGGQTHDTAAVTKAAAELTHRAKRAAQQAALASANYDQAIAKTTKEQSAAAQKIKKAQAALKTLVAQQAQMKPDYPPLGPTYPQTSTGRRKALALWMTDRRNPLTARVAVNHIWLRHFGKPLVASVFDFGRSGDRPTHPELLDWLAVELMENNWSMKHLHRLIVTSRTYQLSSRPGPNHENAKRDSDNRFYWRFDRRRLEAEAIRDCMLQVSGQLDTTMGGQEIATQAESTSRRRSLYFAIYPEAKGTMKFLTLFDAPDPGDCYRRSTTIVPQQALALNNSELVLNQSRRLAAVLSKEFDIKDNAGFVTAAFQQILCRSPNATEVQVCLEFLKKQQTLFKSQKLPKASGSKTLASPSTNTVVRARESLIRTLFSHNDFVTMH